MKQSDIIIISREQLQDIERMKECLNIAKKEFGLLCEDIKSIRTLIAGGKFVEALSEIDKLLGEK